MGRAIDMENKIEDHEYKLKKLEELVYELEDTLDTILSMAEPKAKTKKENKNAKKTDNKRNSDGVKQSDKRHESDR